ncbi:MAG: sulfotransferase [Brumimicrobium sp.]
MKNNKFNGPLFIVGLSRSGTKLLRDLLNRNNLINIPVIETHFIPNILKQENISLDEVEDIIKTSKFRERQQNIPFPKRDELMSFNKIETVKDYIEAALKYYGVHGRQKWNEGAIWGDKTPLYLRHLDILKNEFPEGKVIHIIRDPRDRALSVKKTWNKSMLRTTEKWRCELENAQFFKNETDFYFELRYEDLLASPKTKLQEICDFLGISFQHKMLELEKSSEKHGDNKQKLTVNSQNSKKFLDYNNSIIKRIEEIAFPYLETYNYEPLYAKKHKPYPRYLMELKKYSDFINFKISNKRKGY